MNTIDKKLDLAQFASWFNEITQTMNGVNTMISPEVNAQKESEATIQAAKNKRNFNIFIGVSILIITILLIWVFTSKNK